MQKNFPKLSTSFGKNLILFMLALFFSFFLCEILVRIYADTTGQIIGKDEEDICNKNVFKKVTNMSDPRRFVPHSINHHEYWEYGGSRPKADFTGGNIIENFTLEDGRKGYGIVYAANTNSQHMRSLQNYSFKKDPKIIRIAALGDSFTWGDQVPLVFSYPALLEHFIPNAEVLNFGMEAIGVDTMYFRWKYEALAFDPDIVIFAIYVDDIRRIQPCITKPTLTPGESSVLIENIPPPSLQEIYETYEEPLFRSSFIDILFYQWKYKNGVKEEQYAYGLAVLESLLQEIQETSLESQTYFLLLIIEHGNDYENDAVEKEAIEQIKQLAENLEISYITANNIFASENYTPSSSGDEGNAHFTAEGYAYLAQGIKNKLQQELLIPPLNNYSFSSDKYTQLHVTNKENRSETYTIMPFELYVLE